MIKNYKRRKLGDILCENGMITKEQLESGLKAQKQSEKRLGEQLVDQRILTEEEVLVALEFQLGISYMNLEQYSIDYQIASLVPETVARRYMVIAVGMDGEKLKVAMKDPLNLFALDDLKLSTNREIIPFIALERSISKLMNQIYTSAQTTSIVGQVTKQMHEEKKQIIDKEEIEADGPFIQLVDNILQRCILKRASDAHIEPLEKEIRIRYRIDGELYEMTRPPKEALDGITTRIKVLAGLDITERRLPQDGRMSKAIEGQQVDLRVSILPTIYGEKTVIRFIYRTGNQLALEEVGFCQSDYEKVIHMLKSPHGIILLTGPTGSGKSTTLAAALRVLNTDNVNIITVEDPVENMIEGINQVATNAKVGLTFASVLRSILRQDPDIIMIGEMRDSETSSIAIRAAITGHLVLSTLHTNDAASSIPRLIDMGTEAYMVGAAVRGVISQRLVRRLCNQCKVKHSITSSEAQFYKIPEGTIVYKAKGCGACNHTGYKGRMAIHEVLMIDSVLQDMISSGKMRAEQIKAVAIKRGMRTLRDNVLEHVLKGNTSMEEMLKVVYELGDE